MSNPFTPGNIVPPERFIGRDEELREIIQNLEDMQSTSIVGKARIGKTSLLRKLEQHFKNQPGNYLPIYLSMDSQSSQATFCDAILDKLPEPKPPVCNIDETTKALEQAHTNGLKVILLLDEFKSILKRPEEFGETFKGALRSLYTKRKIALVLATRQPISQIPGLSDYYFANGITCMDCELGYFNEDEAKDFMNSYPFTNEEVKLGLKIGKRHPLRLQFVGYYLYKAKKGQPPNWLYTQHGKLKWNASFILGQKVERKYQDAMQNSRSNSHPKSQNPLESLGRWGINFADLINILQGRIFLVTIIVTAILKLSGWSEIILNWLPRF